MTPGVFLPRLLGCFLCGVLLGPVTDLLRPLHPRLPRLTETVLSAALLAAWLFTSFGLCRGDLQLGYYLATLGASASGNGSSGEQQRPFSPVCGISLESPWWKSGNFFKKTQISSFQDGKNGVQ